MSDSLMAMVNLQRFEGGGSAGLSKSSGLLSSV